MSRRSKRNYLKMTALQPLNSKELDRHACSRFLKVETDILVAQMVVLVDDLDRVRAIISSAKGEQPQVTLHDRRGTVRLEIGLEGLRNNEEPYILVRDRRGEFLRRIAADDEHE